MEKEERKKHYEETRATLAAAGGKLSSGESDFSSLGSELFSSQGSNSQCSQGETTQCSQGNASQSSQCSQGNVPQTSQCSQVDTSNQGCDQLDTQYSERPVKSKPARVSSTDCLEQLAKDIDNCPTCSPTKTKPSPELRAKLYGQGDVRCVTRKQTLRSLTLSYQKKDGRAILLLV